MRVGLYKGVFPGCSLGTRAAATQRLVIVHEEHVHELLVGHLARTSVGLVDQLVDLVCAILDKPTRHDTAAEMKDERMWDTYLGRGHGLAQLGQELTELVRRDVASACAEVIALNTRNEMKSECDVPNGIRMQCITAAQVH